MDNAFDVVSIAAKTRVLSVHSWSRYEALKLTHAITHEIWAISSSSGSLSSAAADIFALTVGNKTLFQSSSYHQ